jgi:two-component system chemotaxis response regulator CheY
MTVQDLHILVIDDSATMRRIIINTLKRLGYDHATEATDGKDALDKMKNDLFDLVITDWTMPEMDGLTLVSVLRRSEKYSQVPILMVTTRSVKEDIVTAVNAGVNGYVVKPFTTEVLETKIEQILSGI